MGEIPIAACDRIIRKANSQDELRVGVDAARELAGELDEIGRDISAEAGKLALHAGRKTVKAKDIRMVTK
jgi:DNA-binding protein